MLPSLAVRLALLLLPLVAACASTSDAEWAVAQRTTWRLETIEGAPALEGIEVTLHLEGERRLFGDAGVNSYFGSFARDGARFATSRIASTRRAGPPDAMRQETRYLELLGSADSVRLERGLLVLAREGREVLSFVATK